MIEDQTRFLKKVFSVIILIILGVFVFKTASANRAPAKSVAEESKALYGQIWIASKKMICLINAKKGMTAMSENMQAEKMTDISEVIKNSKVHIRRAFNKITLQQLDEEEHIADDIITQYWERELLFFGRDDEFALYGMNEERAARGLIVRRNDSLFFMDEYYFSPAISYPRLFAEDFDGDGKKEAAIILHRLTGTEYSVEELFLLDETELETVSDWKLYQFEAGDYLKQLEEKIGIEVFHDKYQVHLFTVDKSQDVLADLSDELIFDDGEIIILEDEMLVGDIVRFYVEDGILKVSFAIGLKTEKYATPLYSEFLPEAEAEISYGDGKFELRNLKFIDDIR